jgi:hypothetical protein
MCHSLQFSLSNVLQAMGTAPSTSKRAVDEEGDENEVSDGSDLPFKDVKPHGSNN